MGRLRRWAACLGLAVLVASTASAAPRTGLRCQARKLRAAGREFRDLLGCHAAGARVGVGPTLGCLSLAHAALPPRFSTYEAGHGCISTGDAAAISHTVDSFLLFMYLAVPTRPSRCEAKRLKSLAAYETDILRAYGRDKLRRHPDAARLQADVGRARAHFVTAFNAAVALGGCGGEVVFTAPQVLDDARMFLVGKLFDDCGDDVQGPSEGCDGVDSPACRLECNPDCTCPHCGDGHLNGVEKCDGPVHDACGTAACQADCTCPAGVCGDGVVNRAGEQCDPPTDGACPGLCRSDCTCPAPVCGNGVVESGETCEPGSQCNYGVSVAMCGDPGGPAACQCCFAPGQACYPECNITCCDGSAPEQQGPRFEICRNFTGRCDPPAICELGSCQPDHSCCSDRGVDCLVLSLSNPTVGKAAPCCSGGACRRAGASSSSVNRLVCCAADGAICGDDAECCTGHCTGGTCEQCHVQGSSCSADDECCYGSCTGGTCATPCLQTNQLCTDGVQCCSGSCDTAALPPGSGPAGRCL